MGYFRLIVIDCDIQVFTPIPFLCIKHFLLRSDVDKHKGTVPPVTKMKKWWLGFVNHAMGCYDQDKLFHALFKANEWDSDTEGDN